MDTVLDWLSMSNSDRPDFVMLYFDEPDHTGHDVGPDGPEVCMESLAFLPDFVLMVLDKCYEIQFTNWLYV